VTDFTLLQWITYPGMSVVVEIYVPLPLCYAAYDNFIYAWA